LSNNYAPITDEDRAAIKELIDKQVETSLARDFDALSELFTEDAIYMQPNYPIHQGKEAVLAFIEAFPTLTEFTVEIFEMKGYGDLAFMRGSYTFEANVEGMESPIQDKGKWIDIVRKENDGSWRLARVIYSSDLPLPE
jgi:uncharacterized protein (TIGR02246 family)